MNYSTAKTILRVFKKEKRIYRKYPTNSDHVRDQKRRNEIDTHSLMLKFLKDYIFLQNESQKLEFIIQNNKYILSNLSKLVLRLLIKDN